MHHYTRRKSGPKTIFLKSFQLCNACFGFKSFHSQQVLLISCRPTLRVTCATFCVWFSTSTVLSRWSWKMIKLSATAGAEELDSCTSSLLEILCRIEDWEVKTLTCPVSIISKYCVSYMYMKNTKLDFQLMSQRHICHFVALCLCVLFILYIVSSDWPFLWLLRCLLHVFQYFCLLSGFWLQDRWDRDFLVLLMFLL